MTDHESSAPGGRQDHQPFVWGAYLNAFHGDHPGITADILGRSFSDGLTPYQWLTEAIPSTGTVIDVACGNAPMAALVGSRWIGVDRSVAELALGRSSQTQPLVLGDAATLPFAVGAADTVVCSMSLQVLEPLSSVIAELGRVIRRGGRLIAIVPTRHPLTWRDRWRYLGLTRALHDGLAFPNDPALGHLAGVMGDAGFDVVDDQSRRFAYQVDDTTVAERFVSSLYVRNVNAARTDAASALARRWVGTSLGIPIRRFVCVRSANGAASTAVNQS